MKRIILIFLCLFCLGCEAKYELVINEDLSVKESITGLEDENFYDQYYKSTKERVIDFMSDTKDEYLEEIGYSKQIVTENDLTGALFVKEFSSLEEYFKRSLAYTQFYENIDYKINNGVVEINLNNQLLENEDSIERYVIDNCNISIVLPFKVKTNNADFIDKKTNTYTWELNNETGKNIQIKFDTKKIYEYKETNTDYVSYLLIIVLITGMLYLIYYIYNKNKLNNKID